MAGGAAARQCDAAPATPVRGQKTGWRQVFADKDRARGQVRFGQRAVKHAEHPVANVPQVAGARPEMHVLGRFVVCDFPIKRLSPSTISRRAGGDGSEGGFRQSFVFEHRDLERQDVGAVASGVGGEAAELFERRGDRRAQSRRLGGRLAGAAKRASAAPQQGDGAAGEAAGSSPPPDAQLSHADRRARRRWRDPPRHWGS